jgi:hypothetical protein
MTDGFKKIQKEAIVASSRYYCSTFLEELRKTTKILSQDSW